MDTTTRPDAHPATTHADTDRSGSRPPRSWVGTDIGLLIIRVAVGVVVGAHGLQKVFGWFDGPGIDGFAGALGDMGFTRGTTFLAWVTALSEVGGGLLLALGLLTPVGAAAVLGVGLNIVYLQRSDPFIGGWELPALFSAVALGLLFSGPGRIAVDGVAPWSRRPVPWGVAGLVLALGTSAVVLLGFR
ncbi:MAG: DoxX family protein [Aeromicrobium sp.]